MKHVCIEYISRSYSISISQNQNIQMLGAYKTSPRRRGWTLGFYLLVACMQVAWRDAVSPGQPTKDPWSTHYLTPHDGIILVDTDWVRSTECYSVVATGPFFLCSVVRLFPSIVSSSVIKLFSTTYLGTTTTRHSSLLYSVPLHS